MEYAHLHLAEVAVCWQFPHEITARHLDPEHARNGPALRHRSTEVDAGQRQNVRGSTDGLRSRVPEQASAKCCVAGTDSATSATNVSRPYSCRNGRHVTPPGVTCATTSA